MITTSPERRRIGIGSSSRVAPPNRKIAALPILQRPMVNTKCAALGESLRYRNQRGGSADLRPVDVSHESILVNGISVLPLR
jgi:hypothetical protein